VCRAGHAAAARRRRLGPWLCTAPGCGSGGAPPFCRPLTVRVGDHDRAPADGRLARGHGARGDAGEDEGRARAWRERAAQGGRRVGGAGGRRAGLVGVGAAEGGVRRKPQGDLWQRRRRRRAAGGEGGVGDERQRARRRRRGGAGALAAREGGAGKPGGHRCFASPQRPAACRSSPLSTPQCPSGSSRRPRRARCRATSPSRPARVAGARAGSQSFFWTRRRRGRQGRRRRTGDSQTAGAREPPSGAQGAAGGGGGVGWTGARASASERQPGERCRGRPSLARHASGPGPHRQLEGEHGQLRGGSGERKGEGREPPRRARHTA
jgi:hypothetical protein